MSNATSNIIHHTHLTHQMASSFLISLLPLISLPSYSSPPPHPQEVSLGPQAISLRSIKPPTPPPKHLLHIPQTPAPLSNIYVSAQKKPNALLTAAVHTVSAISARFTSAAGVI